MNFYQNPSDGSRVVPCGQTDMTKLIVAFCSFANAPKNYAAVYFKQISRLKNDSVHVLSNAARYLKDE
jgi:hypothetical protein